jgi:UDPglucose--hexose-1-phosphate uridylyltransferase
VIKSRLERPDGRYLYYYAFDQPLPPVLDAREHERAGGRVELRWNALLGEYVIISTGRQERTFLPPAEYCPLCPTRSAESFATEVPSPDYEIVAFENRFPSFRSDAPPVADESALNRRARAAGACEVVLYSPEHDANLASLPEAHVRRLVDVWADRYGELSADRDVRYVFIFENRGKEIGVTLTHPHGQIYTFPYIPPRVALEHAAVAEHDRITGRCVLCEAVEDETKRRVRVVLEDDGFLAYVPFAARVPYEVHVVAREHRGSLLELDGRERAGLARTLRRLQATYDGLWGFEMPYTMSMHQRPTDGAERPGDHLHIEFAPPYRSRDKLKYLAGVETGAGTFINDTAPEEKAAELRAARDRVLEPG